ncbi:MAG: methionine adenosyltransferase [Burkholderiales bacterium]|nr:methionine adenosyltransferase [Burkholderiales bacterium]
MRTGIGLLPRPSPSMLPFEVAERKGLGHPDTICDALAENLSTALSRFYLERFGAILHHNVDKALLCGGAARPAFGGGEVTEPIEIYLAGRATRAFRGVQVPVDEIAVEESRAWLRRNLSHLDAQRHVRLIPRIRPTSCDLADLYVRAQEGGIPRANDTSVGTGYAPLDALERAVLAAERALTSADARAAQPEIGEDVKVRGVRVRDSLSITLACALVGAHVAGMADYAAKKARIARRAQDAACAAGGLACALDINTADGDSPRSIYLTVTGLSAEAGDDGQVGRGNRANGLITPCRPMSLEAAAGKNPVTHAGKLYNIAAGRIARALCEEVPGIEEACCHLVSRIGHPITEPQIADLKVRFAGDASGEAAALLALEPAIMKVLHSQLAALPGLWRERVTGVSPLW